MERVREKLTGPWSDTSKVLPESGRDVWFIAGDVVFAGIYEGEQKMFGMADSQGYDLCDVRQWKYIEGELHKGEFPKEGQKVTAKIKDFSCYVTGFFSKHFVSLDKLEEVPGLYLDLIYCAYDLPFGRSIDWTDVFEWYAMPDEPIVLLPPCDGLPEGVSDSVEDLIPEVVEGDCGSETVEEEKPKSNSAIVNSANEKTSHDFNFLPESLAVEVSRLLEHIGR